MKSEDVTQTAVVSPSEEFLLRTVVDSDFRTQVSTHPETIGETLAFHLPVDIESKLSINNKERNAELELPMSVEQQHIYYAELVEDVKGSALAPPVVSDSCRCTCVSGLTWKCDGTTM